MLNARLIYHKFLLATLLMVSSGALLAQNAGRRAGILIHDPVDENKLTELRGNTRPEANRDNDLGPVRDDLTMDHMMLQLKRSPEQEKAAAKFVDDLHDRKSANFHKWVTASEFGRNFGVADADIKAVTDWLESQGFVVQSVYPSGMLIDFSGSAGQVARAFHTSIHNLEVNGARHIANFGDPQIPDALAPVVAGVVSLHNFKPHSMLRPKYTFPDGRSTAHAVTPSDLATIYDFNPLFNKGTTGAGQSIAVIEDTDLYNTADWSTFRGTFGLSQYSGGSLKTVYPAPASGANNCVDPGVNGDDVEAALDVEMATAAAPGATIINAACSSTRTTFGQYIAMANLINGANPPSIMSLSYGICEAENGAASNASLSALYQQAVAEGISIFVAAGDEGAASCDADTLSATHGIGVSGWASTPYNVAVGGTDFSDTLDGTSGAYWAAGNSGSYGSAMSYIPEIPWNSSCASALLATHFGYTTAYGPNGFCNSGTAINEGYIQVAGGSGGPSNCATGVSKNPGVSDGSCQGVGKPSWQTGLPGIPNDGVRDLPDVSLFASNGTLPDGPYYVICFSDPEVGAPCKGAPSNWAGFGGTSASAPVLAGIQALVNQSVGGAQGNPNTVYYALAAGANAASIFHSITRGDIEMNCVGSVNCFGSTVVAGWGRGGRGETAGASGALSVSSSSFTPAYATGPSWNFATGIGSVDVFNLVTNWIKQ